ncbi:MAG: RHS repeat-associated core domain-containing protein [Verrucomicrobiales bacterium]|nr:RHS repeat-associated core domain-containing protein [Verrucomicrobiales bacterium]
MATNTNKTSFAALHYALLLSVSALVPTPSVALGERISFVYDADGQRVAAHRIPSEEPTASAGLGEVRFLIDPLAPNGFPQVVAQLGNDQLVTIPFLHGLGPIWEGGYGGQMEAEAHYLILDGSSSVRISAPESYATMLPLIRIQTSYDSFGIEIESGSYSSHRFRGEKFDPTIGMLHLRSRDYVVSSGRFTTMDSFEGHADRPNSLHKYTYAEGDPINRVDPSGHESLVGVSIATSMGTSLHSLYDEAVSSTGFALMDTVKGVQAGLTADAIYQEYLVGVSLGLGVGVAISRGAGALSSFRLGRLMANEASVTRRLFALLGKSSYWEHAGGISAQAARTLAESHGFGLEIGRLSRFENARNAVVIGRQDLVGGEINRIMLAEEIQHGLDRATSEASQAIKRGLDNVEFHAELFQRIIQNHERGRFPFLTLEDIQGLKAIISELK